MVIPIEADKYKVIDIGFEGENDVVDLVFDVHGIVETFGSGQFTIAMRDKTGDYPVPCTYENGLLHLLIKREYLIKGYAYCQWTYTVGITQVKKSNWYTMNIRESIGSSGTVPSREQPWVSVVEGYKTDAETYKNQAEAYKNQAESALAQIQQLVGNGFTWGQLKGGINQ